jgi:hypothetical protein
MFRQGFRKRFRTMPEKIKKGYYKGFRKDLGFKKG